MEEKERYSYDYFIDGAVFIDTENDRDMDMDTVCSLLNKQDKCIKELEEENKQLKQSQKQLAIEELEKVKEEMVLNGSDYCEIRQGTSPHNPTDYAWFNYVIFRKFIDNQIKELGGKENE